MEEESLIQCAQQGDEKAFQQLVLLHHRAVWRTARVLLADRSAAEDAVQEAWLDAWKNLARFQSHRPFRPWVLVIVANRCHKLTRRHAVPLLSLDDDAGDSIADLAGDDDIAAETIRLESRQELQHALATLPPAQQQLLELHYYAGLDQAEIALLTHVPLGTVKSRLHRALHALRAYIIREQTVIFFGEEPQ